MKQKYFNRRLHGCLIMFVAIALSFSLIQTTTAQEKRKSFKIGLAVLKDNPDYHNGRTAFADTLREQRDIDVKFILLDADGDEETYRQGLKKLVNEDKVDLIFTTGTRSTIPAVEIIKDIPVIFTAVAAPIQSHIVESLEHPGGNVTGTHCAVPEYAQIKTIMKVLPNAKRMGIVYTKGESNAEIQTQSFITAIQEEGLEAFTSTVTKGCQTEEEVAEATKQLIGKVDVLIAHQDTSLSRYGKGMIAVAEENAIPTYVSLGQLVDEGAMFSLGIDFKALGVLSGQQALKILEEGVNPGEIPVETDKKYSLTINLAAAKKIGMAIPVRILKSASKIIK